MISSPQPQHQRPRLPGSVSGGSTGNGASNGSSGTLTGLGSMSSIPSAVGNGPVPFYNIHQPSARSPLSQETTPFGLFRHKNLSTSALPSTQSPSSASSSNLVLAPVTTASTMSFSPNSSYTNLIDTNNSGPKSVDPTSRPTANYSPSTPVLPPLPPLAKLNTASSPKTSGRPLSFQYVTQYYAWWDYIARDHDELSFKKGDILLVIREFDDLWCLGSVMRPDKRTSARHGFFPLQYCSLESQCYIPSAKVTARSGAIPGTESGGRLSIVHPYIATAQDELTLRPGNQVRLIHVFEDGWILGEQIDHAGAVLAVGVFPAAVARPVTASILESVSAGAGTLAGAAAMSSPSKQRHVGSPLVPPQDIGLTKAPRQREESNSSNASTFNTLYSQQNSSTHMLQYSVNNGSVGSSNSSASTIKLPGSPTSSPFIPGQQNHRASPPIIPVRSPLPGVETLRAGTQSNRASVQSTASSNDGKRGGNSTGAAIVTEEQVIRALQERPAQDAVLQLYLAQRGDPNIVDANGNSLLHLAIIAHSQASLVFLLNAPDIRLEHGSPISPLYTAVRFRSWKAAQQLLIQGADPNVHDERGVSVLHVVLLFMTKGDTLAEEVVHLLCENKADVNCTANDKKIIPLLIAVERELWAEVEILMAYGANPYLIWGRDRRQSIGLGQGDGAISNGILTTGYFNDPLWEAVNDDKVHLVRLLLKFFYAPTSFAPAATSSSPSPSPSSTQSSQSFFGPQHSFLHHSSASSYTTNNGSSGNVNIPNLPHGGSIPMPFAGNGVGGHGTPPSMPSPSSAQSSPGSAVLAGYMSHRTNAADSVGSPKLTAIQGGSGHVGSFTNASANANMGANPAYVITPKVLLQALTLAKDLGHHDCLQVLSRPEVTMKEGTLYGTGSYGYNQLQGFGHGGSNYGGHGHGANGGAGGGHGGGKEHRNLIQKLTSLFK